jgi:serine/threonine protein kinase
LALTMSTYTSEPGTRLAGRYRLVDQIAAGSGWTMWKAMDETLARPVTVLTFAPGFPRVTEVVTAARAASRLNDPRLAQVFDVEDADGGAYVVMEWVAGDTLTDMLASGPLDAGRACALVIEAARALAGAHGTGLAHLRLLPHSLRWTRTSGVKITGLGIDAALAGAALTSAAAEDPARADTEGLASLLYAALTGYWPGDEQTNLPPAPISDGAPCTPRQVSAEIPHDIDAVVCRALLHRPTRNDPPILTPATFADALTGVAPPIPLPEPAPNPWAGTAPRYPGNPTDPANWALPDARRAGQVPPYRRQPATGRSAAARGIISVVIVLVLAAIAATAWVISSSMHKGTASSSSSQPPSASASAPPSSVDTVLTPAGVSTFNAYKPDNNEDSEKAPLAIDGKPDTAWSTQWYGSANLGGLKPGTGLLLDMGKQVKLSQVEVLFGAGSTSADIYLGNSNTVSVASFGTFTKVGSATSVSGDYKYPVSSSATGRYVLIWLTGLPPALPNSGAPAGKFIGLIYEVTVRGTPASTAG